MPMKSLTLPVSGSVQANWAQQTAVPVPRFTPWLWRLIWRWTSLVSDVTKARLEEKRQEIKTQVDEKAKDLFRVLLGR